MPTHTMQDSASLNQKPRILLWDIESTNLKMDFGTILCIGYKWLGEKETHVISIMDFAGWKKRPTDDRRVVEAFLKVYNSADTTITWYGRMFDLPAVTAKCMEYRLGIPSNVPMVDLYFTARNNLAISRRSLKNVSEYLGLDTEKTPVAGHVWRSAMGGDSKSIRYVIEHCEKDVEVLEEAYECLKPLVRTHPRTHRVRTSADCTCRVCGSENVLLKARVISAAGYECRRTQCQDCGYWSRTGKHETEVAKRTTALFSRCLAYLQRPGSEDVRTLKKDLQEMVKKRKTNTVNGAWRGSNNWDKLKKEQ